MTFKSGESGNKNGRPKNSGHRQQLFSALVEPHKNALFDTAINLALNGNETMLRLFLERLLPSKPTDETIFLDFPTNSLTNPNTLLNYGEIILNATSQGLVTPMQAKAIMSSLEIQRRNIETAELAERVSAIEKILKQRK